MLLPEESRPWNPGLGLQMGPVGFAGVERAGAGLMDSWVQGSCGSETRLGGSWTSTAHIPAAATGEGAVATVTQEAGLSPLELEPQVEAQDVI